MSAVILGERVGHYVVFRDADDRRHAVRLTTILAASDADDDHCSTVLTLPGGRSVLVDVALDSVLTWLISPEARALRQDAHAADDTEAPDTPRR